MHQVKRPHNFKSCGFRPSLSEHQEFSKSACTFVPELLPSKINRFSVLGDMSSYWATERRRARESSPASILLTRTLEVKESCYSFLVICMVEEAWTCMR